MDACTEKNVIVFWWPCFNAKVECKWMVLLAVNSIMLTAKKEGYLKNYQIKYVLGN